MPKEKEMTWAEATRRVLNEANAAMKYTEIATAIIRKGYKKNIGRYPDASVNTALNGKLKDEVEVIRPGVYVLYSTLERTGKDDMTVEIVRDLTVDDILDEMTDPDTGRLL